jgi:hypothetical protein
LLVWICNPNLNYAFLQNHENGKGAEAPLSMQNYKPGSVHLQFALHVRLSFICPNNHLVGVAAYPQEKQPEAVGAKRAPFYFLPIWPCNT